MQRLILPRRKLLVLAAPALILPHRRAEAQGGMMPGPGTVHSTGGGGGGIWTLKNSVQFTSSGGLNNGGTTAAVDFTGVNLITRFVPYYLGGTFTSVSDSSSNSWGSPVIGAPFGLAGASNGFNFYFLINPTVSAAQTFTVVGTGIGESEIVQGWIDSSGTPAFDTGYQNNGSTASTSGILAGQAAYTATTTNVLVISGIMSLNTAGVVYSIDTGFTITNQAPTSGSNVGSALAWLKETSIVTSLNPAWSLSPADSGGVASFMFGFKP